MQVLPLRQTSAYGLQDSLNVLRSSHIGNLKKCHLAPTQSEHVYTAEFPSARGRQHGVQQGGITN